MKRILTDFLSLSVYIRMIRVDPCPIYSWLSSYLPLMPRSAPIIPGAVPCTSPRPPMKHLFFSTPCDTIISRPEASGRYSREPPHGVTLTWGNGPTVRGGLASNSLAREAATVKRKKAAFVMDRLSDG